MGLNGKPMRYVSDNVISFSIRVAGRTDSARVNFLPVSSGGSTYSTDIKPLIEALEKSSMFGKVYRRAPECEEDVIQKKEVKARKVKAVPKTVKVEEVKDWQDAVIYLVENHGVRREKLVAPELILKEAENAGIEFPNLGK